MHLYSGPTARFVDDNVHNQLAEKLKAGFFQHYRRAASPSEVQSWRNSLRAMSQVVDYAGLEDTGVVVEYPLPLSSKRIDCMFTGHAGSDARAVIVELKQWEHAEPAEGERVLTFVGQAHREVLHPSAQVSQYRQYLAEQHPAFYDEDPVALESCSYLHNYAFQPQDALLDDRYVRWVADSPVFSLNDVDPLADFLRKRLGDGDGMPVLDRIVTGRYRPSRKLMDHVADVIKRNPAYTLLDEQAIVFDQVMAHLGKVEAGRKLAVIVKGGPGTGKSVVAINLLAEALSRGHVSHYATGSKSFTETLRKVVGARGSSFFRYFNGYGDAEANAVDLLVSDEAHRIRTTSASRFTPAAKRTGKPQVRELMEASKVSVFLLDDHQVVRPNEIGSAQYIRDAAAELGVEVKEYELAIQFRCGGSDAFVNWVNNTLGIKRTPNVLWEGHPDFEFGIAPSPEALEAMIRAKAAEGHNARLVAGFCWDWSDPRPDGTLVDDIVIGDWKRPWDAKHDAKRLAPGIPKAALWAHDPRGIDQVGCIYTAQGFEFDYVGVIFGRDLYYDPATAQWRGRREESSDSVVKRSKEDFVRLVKNTYRVLLSRGMKGCYVYFMDKDTENFVRSRLEGGGVGKP
jgi:uncharacterized protein